MFNCVQLVESCVIIHSYELLLDACHHFRVSLMGRINACSSKSWRSPKSNISMLGAGKTLHVYITHNVFARMLSQFQGTEQRSCKINVHILADCGYAWPICRFKVRNKHSTGFSCDRRFELWQKRDKYIAYYFGEIIVTLKLNKISYTIVSRTSDNYEKDTLEKRPFWASYSSVSYNKWQSATNMNFAGFTSRTELSLEGIAKSLFSSYEASRNQRGSNSRSFCVMQKPLTSYGR